MKKKLLCAAVAASCILLSGCGSSESAEGPVQSGPFETKLNAFCDSLVKYDEELNRINPDGEDAPKEMLEIMDDMEESFNEFAALDFPTEFDYLEPVADEAASYMTEAVSKYTEAFSNGSYNEYTAEYAKENYARAYKRVKIVIALLNGEEVEDVTVTEGEAE